MIKEQLFLVKKSIKRLIKLNNYSINWVYAINNNKKKKISIYVNEIILTKIVINI